MRDDDNEAVARSDEHWSAAGYEVAGLSLCSRFRL